MTEYNDNYPTCARTYATLRIYPGEPTPDEITRRLGVEPTSTQLTTRAGNPLHGWFLCSEHAVDSRDVRRHLDWLLRRIEPAAQELTALLAQGGGADVSCYWVSASGHGGPTLSPELMSRLAALQLECWFDVYMDA